MSNVISTVENPSRRPTTGNGTYPWSAGPRFMGMWFAGILAAGLLFADPSAAQEESDTVAPESATGIEEKTIVTANRHMIAAAHPLAVEAGLEILRQGGSAADALVTVQTILGLVEPQSSGIGGGAFVVWYDAEHGEVTTFDGRETAPMAATQDLFLDDDGAPLSFFDAVTGGRSIGTPGVIRLLERMHQRYGKLPWADLFAPAIDRAREGFRVTDRLSALIASDIGRLDMQEAAKAYFFDTDGTPLEPGTILKNPDYAQTLALIAGDGATAFYNGEIADAIIQAVSGHPTNPGLLTKDDLAGYDVKERPATCAPYRGYDICGMGPPSSGALTIGQILGIVSHFDVATLGPDDPQSWRIIGDATRLAFADRGLYMADSDFVDMPEGLLDAAYLRERAALIRQPVALAPDQVTAGTPPWDKAHLRVPGMELEQPSTTHFVIVDGNGNIASVTSSVESAFGSRQVAAGFVLNNQLTDFNFAPEENGEAVANRVEPGKRPRSSMSPTIILHEGKPVYALGSPGGSNIIPYVAKTIIALIDWKMDIQQAINLPHLTNRFGTYELEENTTAANLADDLGALGFETKIMELNSGLHGVAFAMEEPQSAQILNGRKALQGGADPRREGIAQGD